ncbi:PQQ-dependent sugar dehydrogenase [Halobaculum litoreum]|uniref:PQQ-dependent sugar dehydrogenase n=1 Tax=Halobaculum litoreum TaxID=3031998 RepID=A0ABD5XSD2_9EURY
MGSRRKHPSRPPPRPRPPRRPRERRGKPERTVLRTGGDGRARRGRYRPLLAERARHRRRGRRSAIHHRPDRRDLRSRRRRAPVDAVSGPQRPDGRARRGLPNWIPYDERGLLGLAFHPDFSENGLFYVRYSAPSKSEDIDHNEVLSEFSVAEDGETADPDSERILLDMPWHRPIHQSGTIEFGPDGYLYGSLGDGLNPYNAQDLTNLMGSVIRIDVDERKEDRPYGIPPSNPLVGEEGLDELYAWGLRNPWKMAFSGDRLIAGDVGQATWEEVDVIESGANYGWPLKEGTRCHDPQLGTSSEEQCVVESERGETLVDPVLEFPHFDEEGFPVGFAVIGGHIHTGDVGAVEGDYLFGAFTSSFTTASGRLLAATPQDSGTWPIEELQVEGGLDIQVLSFGQDGDDSYVLGTRAALADDPLSKNEGVVYRLTE